MRTLEEVFSANLRLFRGRRTQAEIAEEAGIPLRSYQHAESGIIPQGPNRTAIAKALGVKETRLFFDDEIATEESHEAMHKLELLSRFTTFLVHANERQMIAIEEALLTPAVAVSKRKKGSEVG